jgi:hypothetical protein
MKFFRSFDSILNINIGKIQEKDQETSRSKIKTTR